MTSAAPCFAATAFFDRTWDEALALSCAARGYAQFRVSRKPADSGTLEGLTVCCELMRVTARLTQVMSWLLVQRAVLSGEMTAEEAADAVNRLERHDACYDGRGEEAPGIPPRLRELLHDSRSLYRRVARLDDMVAAGRA